MIKFNLTFLCIIKDNYFYHILFHTVDKYL